MSGCWCEVGVGAPPRGLCKAPRDSGLCWKQLMMCLEEIRFVVVIHLRFFNLTPMHGPGRRRNSRPAKNLHPPPLELSPANKK